MSTALTSVPAPLEAATLEAVLLGGDLTKLKPAERVAYMTKVCESLGLNPLTKPFEFITLNGKLVMYARRECTEQLRKLNGVSVRIVAREYVDDIYVVTASATDRHGRVDESTGAVTVKGLSGENKANALMKAETKAKRRVTLSISGLGMLDESETPEVLPGPALAYVEATPAPKALTPSPSSVTGPAAVSSADSSAAPAASSTATPAQEMTGEQVACWIWKVTGGTAKGGNQTGEWESIGLHDQRTLAQNAKLHALRQEVGITDEEWRSKLVNKFNKESSADLSIYEAKVVIDQLELRKKKGWTAAEKSQRQARKVESVGETIASHYAENEAALAREPGSDDE